MRIKMKRPLSLLLMLALLVCQVPALGEAELTLDMPSAHRHACAHAFELAHDHRQCGV